MRPAASIMLSSTELYLYDVELDLPAELLRDYTHTLSPAELQRADRFYFERDRSRFIGAHGQLRAVLAEHAGCSAAALRFEFGPYGKPTLDTTLAADLHFSWSRSGHVGVLAVQRGAEVGVDVELIRPLPTALDIAARHFAREEYLALSSLPDNERDAAFFRYWTCKEAAVKSIGLGLSQPLRSFVVPAEGSHAPIRVVLDVQGTTVTRWLIDGVPSSWTGAHVAIATATPPAATHRQRYMAPFPR